MIENISIKKFKSIYSDDITLKPFTVLVGANGSGKSNLIKALDFLGTIPRSGIAAAVSKFGGFEGLVPKAIPRIEIKSARVKLNYQVRLPEPEGYLEQYPQIAVEHDIELAHSKEEIIKVSRENIVYHQPLSIAKFTSEEMNHDVSRDPDILQPSKFTITRGPRGGIYYSAEPSLEDEVEGYFQWLGLPFLLEDEEIKSVNLRKILNILERGGGERIKRSDRLRLRSKSYLDPDYPSIVRFSPQADVFKRILRSVRRYDLLLGELRKDQQISDSRFLSTEGNNMPSVLRYLISDPQMSEAWHRIINTLSAISPYIESLKSDSLRTGKEYVNFIENTLGRAVESWESSDGTLRTLAILLALETSPSPSTILIEEPEQNLHPWSVRLLVDHIREVIEIRNIQVIITTHSQQILERAYPNEVLVATRTDQGGTIFRLLDEIVPDSKIAMGEVGELWVKGLLGGVPSYE